MARRYASAVCAVVVCPSVRPSHAHIVPKRLNVESRKQRHTALVFWCQKSRWNSNGITPTEGQIEVG